MHENKEKYTKGAGRIALLMQEAGGARRAADLAELTVSFFKNFFQFLFKKFNYKKMKLGVEHITQPKDTTSILIKAIPHLLAALLTIFLFKIIKFITFGIYKTCSVQTNTKLKRA